MAEKNYYDILGVSKKASEDEIKKAYRKLVRQYHPDVSKDPKADEKISEINNAYETLKDKDKRAQYDMMLDNPFMGNAGGFQGFGGQGQNIDPKQFEEILRQFGGGANTGFDKHQQGHKGGFNFEDIFSAFTGGFSRKNPNHQTSSDKGEDQHTELTIDLQASYTGDTRKVTLNINQQQKTIQVKIPKGIIEGQKIRLAKQGSPSLYGGEAGDLYLKVKFAPVDNIQIDGKNVIQTVNISPWEAVLGGSIAVDTPVGRIGVNIPKNSQTGNKLRLKDKGIPAKEAGDLLLKLNVVMPNVETKEQELAFEQLKNVFSDFKPKR